MRFTIILSVLFSGFALSQPAKGILKDTTLQGPVKKINEVQFYADNLDSAAFKYNYYFDAEGNLLREDQWKESEYIVRWNRTYDESGNLIEHNRESKFREVDKDSFAYDEQNNLVLEMMNIGGPFPKKTIYEYDENGNLEREERYVSGNLKGTKTYSYEDGNMTKVESNENNKESIEWITYDDQDRVLKTVKVYENREGNEDTCTITYSYPEENVEITEDSCMPQFEKLVYNKRGQLTHEEWTRKVKNGAEHTIIKRSYNPQGQVTKKQYSIQNETGEKEYFSETVYEYEYDEYDNWIKLDWYKLKDGIKELKMRFIREFTYM